jgi:transcriptional regulator with XRE-family HTH domain
LNSEISERFSRSVVAALKSARVAQSISQSQLARLSGVSRAMINHLESGKRNPTLIVVHALANALGENLEKVVGTVQRSI